MSVVNFVTVMAEGPSPKKCKLEVSLDEDTPQDTLLSNNNCPETITDRDKTDDATFKVCFIYKTLLATFVLLPCFHPLKPHLSEF